MPGTLLRPPGKAIPDHYEFEVLRIKDSKRSESFDHLMGLNAPGPFCMGAPEEETDKVVAWTFLVDQEDPFRSIWLLWFYQSVFIEIFSGPPGEHRQLKDNLAARKQLTAWTT